MSAVVSTRNNVIRMALPVETEFPNTLVMPMRAPTEAPRLLREWRASQTPFMSQERAAEILGVKFRNYARWERGDHLPYFKTVEEIAPKMGLDASAFYPQPEETASETKQRIIHIEEMLTQLLAHLEGSRLLDEVESGQADRQPRAAARRRKSSGRSA